MWSVWLVFRDCGFHSVCPLMAIRIRSLWKLPDGRDWLKGKLGLVLMRGTMLRKSLTQFSVDGWGCVPSLLFDLRANYGGGNEDNDDLLQRSCARTATLCAPNPAAGHHWPTPLLEPPRYSWASLVHSLVGSLLLFPGSWCAGPWCAGFACALQESVSSFLCVSSGDSMVGLMAVSSKKAYAIPRSAAPGAPAPVAGHCWPVPAQETLKHSKAGLNQKKVCFHSNPKERQYQRMFKLLHNHTHLTH